MEANLEVRPKPTASATAPSNPSSDLSNKSAKHREEGELSSSEDDVSSPKTLVPSFFFFFLFLFFDFWCVFLMNFTCGRFPSSALLLVAEKTRKGAGNWWEKIVSVEENIWVECFGFSSSQGSEFWFYFILCSWILLATIISVILWFNVIIKGLLANLSIRLLVCFLLCGIRVCYFLYFVCFCICFLCNGQLFLIQYDEFAFYAILLKPV